MKTFPIILDDEIKTIPWDMIADARMRMEALGQPVKTVEELAVAGLTPEDAIAFVTNKPWERMGATEARLRLLQLVEEWKKIDADTREALGMPVVQEWGRLDVGAAAEALRNAPTPTRMGEPVKGANLVMQAKSIIPEPRDLADKTLADLDKARALLQSMQRRVNTGTTLWREHETLLKIVADTGIAVRALRHRRPTH